MDDLKTTNNGTRMDGTMELVTRASLSSLQKETADGRIISPNSFDEWTWTGLRVSDLLITLEPVVFTNECLKSFNCVDDILMSLYPIPFLIIRHIA